MWETWVQSLVWEDPLEKGTATHSSSLAWRIPWTQEPGILQSMGSQRVRHDWGAFIPALQADSLLLRHQASPYVCVCVCIIYICMCVSVCVCTLIYSYPKMLCRLNQVEEVIKVLQSKKTWLHIKFHNAQSGHRPLSIIINHLAWPNLGWLTFPLCNNTDH